MKKVNQQMKEQIKLLYAHGNSFAKIGRQLDISECTVAYWAIESRRNKIREDSANRLKEYYAARLLLKERCCPKCKVIKPMSEFRKTQSYCKTCIKAYGREYNKTFRRSANLKAADKLRRKIKKKLVALLLGGKCNDCGLLLTDTNLCVFDLHHKNLADKECGEDWRSPEMMKKITENKITLLCSNCHRLLHHKNGDSLYATPKLKLLKDISEVKSKSRTV